jgi:hypothetical protein
VKSVSLINLRLNVLHIAAKYRFPYAVLSRLVQCGCNINAKVEKVIINNRVEGGNTVIVDAAHNCDFATFDSLALLGADLSVKDSVDKLYISQYEYTADYSSSFIHLRELHGIKSDRVIPDGFVSPHKGKASSMPEAYNESILKI